MITTVLSLFVSTALMAPTAQACSPDESRVEAVYPAADSEGHPTNSEVTVALSEGLNSEVAVAVLTPNGEQLSGTTQFIGFRHSGDGGYLRFTPDADLEAETTYLVDYGQGEEDLHAFMTAADVDLEAPRAPMLELTRLVHYEPEPPPENHSCYGADPDPYILADATVTKVEQSHAVHIYEVETSGELSGAPVAVGMSDSLSWSDHGGSMPGNVLCYAAIAIDTAGNESEPSATECETVAEGSSGCSHITSSPSVAGILLLGASALVGRRRR